MNQLATKERIFATAFLAALICAHASAKGTAEFSSLYEQKSYNDVCKLFEAHETANWRDPNSAYYYALSLLRLGKTDTAVAVCKTIQQRYPSTEAAKQAKSLIDHWAPKSEPKFKAKSEPKSNEHSDDHTGIVGLKFVVGYGVQPTINKVFPKTPAALAGLTNGDIIESVDGNATEGLTKEQVYDLITGPPQSVVTITIFRNGAQLQKQLIRMNTETMRNIDPGVYEEYLKAR